MTTPLTEQIRAYFGDVERHQGGIDVATLRHGVEEGEVITVEGPQVDWRPPNAPISRPRWPIIIIAAATLIVIAGLIVSDVRESRDTQRAVAPPVANGLIAFVGESPDDPATSDIFVVTPDGTGLRPLTSTPEFVEYAPAWSPDGSRLAFVRASADELAGAPPLCVTGCQLVVVDPSTGVETFSAEIPPTTPLGIFRTLSLTWSPHGRAILMRTLGCVPGPGGGQGYGCGVETRPPLIADLETAAFTTLTPFVALATWSPDGEWLLIRQNADGQPGPLLLVPADLIATGNVDIGELPGVRPLQEPVDVDSLARAATVEWMPDSSAILDTRGHPGNGPAWIDVVTVPDGERHTLIDNGFDPVVSPDGHQIAYRREDSPDGVTEIWVANANGSDQQRVAVSSTPPAWWPTPPAWSPDSTLLLFSDQQKWFTVRPDGTHRTALGFRVHTFPGFPSGVDWQPVR